MAMCGTDARGRGPAGTRGAGRGAFTLLEMLTVMVIIVMLMTLASAAWFQMRRGAELRGAVSTLRTALVLGRQQAVTRRRDVMVIFRQEGETNVFYLFEKSGNVSAGSGPLSFVDTSGALQSVPTNAQVGNYVCNLTDRGIGLVADVNGAQGVVTLRSPGLDVGAWDPGDEYGWAAHLPYYLPPGIKFVGPLPTGIRFTPDGGGDGAGTVQISIAEKQGNPAQSKLIKVYKLTGVVDVQ